MAWNRASCISGDSKDQISLPIGYEGLYGILAAKIQSIVVASPGGGRPARLTLGQKRKLGTYLRVARSWDVSKEITDSLFPTARDIPSPIRKQSSSNIPSNELTTASVRSVKFIHVSKSYCRAGGYYFKEKYRPTLSLPLVHKDQHCCSKACFAYRAFARFGAGSVTMAGCCRLCNKHSCKVGGRKSSLLLTAAASMVESPPKISTKRVSVNTTAKTTKTQAAVYVFVL